MKLDKELYLSLKEGLKDIEEGNTRPFKEAVEDIRNRRTIDSSEFDDLILKELIDEGYSGSELIEEFRIRRSKIRPAVEAMLEEAKNVANGNGEYFTKDEVFDSTMKAGK